MFGAILLMGGLGERFGTRAPKQFHLLGGKALYLYALETLLGCNWIDEVVLVCHRDWMVEERERVRVVEGGATRQESAKRGLKGFTQKPDFVLIHDAVRPFVSEQILRANREEVLRTGAVDTCVRAVDTVVYAPQGNQVVAIPQREEYWRGQTPQTFRYEWMVEAHEQALKKRVVGASDDCQLALQAGYSVSIVPGDEKNFKITTLLDLQLAETLLSQLPASR